MNTALEILYFLFLWCAVLDTRSVNCFANNTNSTRFLVTRNEGRVISLWQNGSEPVNLVQDLEFSTVFDFSYEEGLLFFQGNRDRIRAARISNVEEHYIVAHSHNEDLEAMAVDWVTKKIYWVARRTTWAQSKCRIDLASFDGGVWTALLHLDSSMSVGSLVVDPLHGYMFWVDKDDMEIVRAWMDGTNATAIVSSPGRFMNNFVVDFQGDGTIFWSEMDRISGLHARILAADFDGKNRRTIRRLPTVGFVLAVFKNHLYWRLVNSHVLFKCLKYEGVCEKTEESISEKFEWFNFHVYEPEAQPKRTAPNPCSLNNGNCSHLCVLIPVPPYRSCRCPIGIRLLSDNMTCHDGYEYLLFVVTRTDLRYISLDTTDFTDVTIPVKNVKHAVAIDYDPLTKFFYWTDQELKKIRRARIDGSGEADVVKTELDVPDGIAVDWVGRNVYWTDAGTARIEVTRIDGSARRVLVSTGLKKPRAIVLDPEKGFMYWSDWHSDRALDPKIEKAYMDGSNRVVLINLGQGHWPNGLTLDTKKRLIYWIDAKTDELSVASSVDGSQRRTVTQGDMQRPFSLSLLNGWLYWSDADRRTVVRVRTNGTGREHVALDIADLYCIRGVNIETPPVVVNECGVNNGNCSHLCLYRPAGRVCRCPIGLELSMNQTSCLLPEKFLIFTQRDTHDIMRISLSTPTTTNLDQLGLQDTGQPWVLDYHAKTQRVYWASVTRMEYRRSSDLEYCYRNSHCSLISQSFLNGTGQKIIIGTGLQALEGLAVDWIAENLYWSDTASKTIEVSRLGGTSRRVIVWKNVKPRDLVVDPTAGYLYWANWGDSHPSIERAELDGSNRATLTRLSGRSFCLSLDPVNQKIYWSQLEPTPGLWTSDLNGGGKKEILAGAKGTNFGSVTHFGGMLYFTDWTRNAIEELNATTGTGRRVLHENLPLVFNLKVVHAFNQKGWNHCYARNNGGCEHLCFAVPSLHDEGTTFRCGCPTHYELVSNRCKEPETFLIVSEKGNFVRFKLDFGGMGEPKFNDYPKVILPLKEEILRARSLQYDPLERHIYWIDDVGSYEESSRRNRRFVIRRTRDDGSGEVEILNFKDLGMKERCEPKSLALDPHTQQMFVLCGQLNAVFAVRLKSHGMFDALGMVLDGHFSDYNIGAIAVSPMATNLIFVDEKRQKLMRCEIDGSSCVSLATVEFSGAVVANRECHHGDYEIPSCRTFVYFSDRFGVRKVALNKGPKEITDGIPLAQTRLGPGQDGLPPALTVAGTKLVVMNPGKSELSTIRTELDHKGDMQQPEHEIDARLWDVSGILVVNRSLTEELKSSQCLRARCSHLCGGERARCFCPTGMSLNKDNKTCHQSISCQNFQFLCKLENRCIHFRRRCDGAEDCQDGSDESECGSCRGQEKFRCEDGSDCLNVNSYCDGKKDCTDNSDEAHCRCPNPAWNFDCSWLLADVGMRAREKSCVPRTALCDGLANCSGIADEHPVTCGNRGTNTRLRNGQEFPDRNYGRNQDSTVVIGIIALISICFFLFALFLFIWWCKRQTPPPATPASVYEMAPLQRDGSFYPSTGTGTHTLLTSAGGGTVLRMDVHHKINIQTGSSGFSGSVPLLETYERSNLTGKSSSSGDRSSYPEQPVPPPSLVSASRRSSRGKRSRRKRSNRRPHHPRRSPPPPYSDDCRYTPCSTEVMDGDSEIPAPPSSVVSSNLPGTSREYGGRDAPPPSLVSFRSGKHQNLADSSQNVYDELPGPSVGSAAPNPSPEQSQVGTDSDLYQEYFPPPPSPANGSSDS